MNQAQPYLDPSSGLVPSTEVTRNAEMTWDRCTISQQLFPTWRLTKSQGTSSLATPSTTNLTNLTHHIPPVPKMGANCQLCTKRPTADKTIEDLIVASEM
jgi:hypothetical protein